MRIRGITNGSNAKHPKKSFKRYESPFGKQRNIISGRIQKLANRSHGLPPTVVNKRITNSVAYDSNESLTMLKSLINRGKRLLTRVSDEEKVLQDELNDEVRKEKLKLDYLDSLVGDRNNEDDIMDYTMPASESVYDKEQSEFETSNLDDEVIPKNNSEVMSDNSIIILSDEEETNQDIIEKKSIKYDNSEPQQLFGESNEENSQVSSSIAASDNSQEYISEDLESEDEEVNNSDQYTDDENDEKSEPVVDVSSFPQSSPSSPSVRNDHFSHLANQNTSKYPVEEDVEQELFKKKEVLKEENGYENDVIMSEYSGYESQDEVSQDETNNSDNELSYNALPQQESTNLFGLEDIAASALNQINQQSIENADIMDIDSGSMSEENVGDSEESLYQSEKSDESKQNMVRSDGVGELGDYDYNEVNEKNNYGLMTVDTDHSMSIKHAQHESSYESEDAPLETSFNDNEASGVDYKDASIYNSELADRSSVIGCKDKENSSTENPSQKDSNLKVVENSLETAEQNDGLTGVEKKSQNSINQTKLPKYVLSYAENESSNSGDEFNQTNKNSVSEPEYRTAFEKDPFSSENINSDDSAVSLDSLLQSIGQLPSHKMIKTSEPGSADGSNSGSETNHTEKANIDDENNEASQSSIEIAIEDMNQKDSYDKTPEALTVNTNLTDDNLSLTHLTYDNSQPKDMTSVISSFSNKRSVASGSLESNFEFKKDFVNLKMEEKNTDIAENIINLNSAQQFSHFPSTVEKQMVENAREIKIPLFVDEETIRLATSPVKPKSDAPVDGNVSDKVLLNKLSDVLKYESLLRNVNQNDVSENIQSRENKDMPFESSHNSFETTGKEQVDKQKVKMLDATDVLEYVQKSNLITSSPLSDDKKPFLNEDEASIPTYHSDNIPLTKNFGQIDSTISPFRYKSTSPNSSELFQYAESVLQADNQVENIEPLVTEPVERKAIIPNRFELQEIMDEKCDSVSDSELIITEPEITFLPSPKIIEQSIHIEEIVFNSTSDQIAFTPKSSNDVVRSFETVDKPFDHITETSGNPLKDLKFCVSSSHWKEHEDSIHETTASAPESETYKSTLSLLTEQLVRHSSEAPNDSINLSNDLQERGNHTYDIPLVSSEVPVLHDSTTTKAQVIKKNTEDILDQVYTEQSISKLNDHIPNLNAREVEHLECHHDDEQSEPEFSDCSNITDHSNDNKVSSRGSKSSFTKRLLSSPLRAFSHLAGTIKSIGDAASEFVKTTDPENFENDNQGTSDDSLELNNDKLQRMNAFNEVENSTNGNNPKVQNHPTMIVSTISADNIFGSSVETEKAKSTSLGAISHTSPNLMNDAIEGTVDDSKNDTPELSEKQRESLIQSLQNFKEFIRDKNSLPSSGPDNEMDSADSPRSALPVIVDNTIELEIDQIEPNNFDRGNSSGESDVNAVVNGANQVNDLIPPPSTNSPNKKRPISIDSESLKQPKKKRSKRSKKARRASPVARNLRSRSKK